MGSFTTQEGKQEHMASQAPTDTGMKPSLGLTGVTINAMALIAPGAFLWTTYQLQSGPTARAVLTIMRKQPSSTKKSIATSNLPASPSSWLVGRRTSTTGCIQA